MFMIRTVLMFLSLSVYASGTFIAPPPQPDNEIDCSKPENSELEECLELAEGRF